MTHSPNRRARRLPVVLLAGLAAAAVLTGCGGNGREDAATNAAEDQPSHTMSTSASDPHPVAGHFSPDDVDLDTCTPGDSRCYEQGFGNLSYHEGPERALERFDRTMASDPAVESNCHRIAHTIGSAALARFDGDVAKAFALGSSSCWSGYYHGILERAFTEASSREEVAGVARRLCADSGIRSSSFVLYQCVHGLGHGLMIWSGYDLPFSLSICDQLDTDWDQTSCTGGVFMENIASSYGVRSQWIRDDDPVYPCQAMKERHKLYCYLMVTSRINELNGFDWKETAAVCRGVEEGWVETCFESYGRDASGSTRQDPVAVARICGFAGTWADACFYGAARDMTSNYANGRRASVLCRRAPSAFRSRCFYGIGTILGSLVAEPNARRSACTDIAPARFRASCISGTGTPVEP
jgi:hypothetical protein